MGGLRLRPGCGLRWTTWRCSCGAAARRRQRRSTLGRRCGNGLWGWEIAYCKSSRGPGRTHRPPMESPWPSDRRPAPHDRTALEPRISGGPSTSLRQAPPGLRDQPQQQHDRRHRVRRHVAGGHHPQVGAACSATPRRSGTTRSTGTACRRTAAASHRQAGRGDQRRVRQLREVQRKNSPRPPSAPSAPVGAGWCSARTARWRWPAPERRDPADRRGPPLLTCDVWEHAYHRLPQRPPGSTSRRSGTW